MSPRVDWIGSIHGELYNDVLDNGKKHNVEAAGTCSVLSLLGDVGFAKLWCVKSYEIFGRSKTGEVIGFVANVLLRQQFLNSEIYKFKLPDNEAF